MTPARGKRSWAVDTSVAVAAVDESHEAHVTCRAAALTHRPALSGHAAFETYSVLTRLPGAARATPEVVGELLDRAFPDRCWLTPTQHNDLLRRCAAIGIVGGMAYDALVGEAARAAGRTLLTRDVRALRTYELIGVRYELVGSMGPPNPSPHRA